MRLSRLNPVLWRYSEALPTDRLLWHHRICMRLLKLWCWSCVAMFAETAKILAMGGRTWEWVLAAVPTGLGLVLTVPALFGLVWLQDIDRSLQQRGVNLPSAEDMEWRIAKTTCKMMLWFAIIVLVANLRSWLK